MAVEEFPDDIVAGKATYAGCGDVNRPGFHAVWQKGHRIKELSAAD